VERVIEDAESERWGMGRNISLNRLVVYGGAFVNSLSRCLPENNMCMVSFQGIISPLRHPKRTRFAWRGKVA